MDRVFYKPDEVAAMFGMGRSRLYELLRTGALASVKVGRSRRIHRDAIADFVASLTDQA